nr:hypothetical protein [uncultured Prevotella sp.]
MAYQIYPVLAVVGLVKKAVGMVVIISPKMENQKANVILVKKEILVDKARAYVGKQY